MSKDKFFYDVIGQEKAKKHLTRRLEQLRKNGALVRHTLFVGSSGDGKSYMARKYGRGMPDPTDPAKGNKDFYTFNGGAIKTPKMLFQILGKINCDKHWTIFIDECHGLNRSVETILLNLLESGGGKTRNVYEFDDVPYEIDFHKHTFLFATTEEDQVFHALKKRLERISMQPYSVEDLAKVIKLSLDGAVSVSKELLAEMSNYIRRNARAADFLARDIIDTGKPKFLKKDWEDLKEDTGLLPLGLTADELRILELLDEGEKSMGLLASRIGRPTSALQKDIEVYPKSLGLMEIDGKRRLTGKGKKYLSALKQKTS